YPSRDWSLILAHALSVALQQQTFEVLQILLEHGVQLNHHEKALGFKMCKWGQKYLERMDMNQSV
ncbi:hypothetical protein, partial [Leptolyngbya sp. GB2-A2]|uniref:hypothetical protein n=1 Tax=Leptolyngbya sp. GB2-A2 TaxID=2933915 RepID=UPI0032979EAD